LPPQRRRPRAAEDVLQVRHPREGAEVGHELDRRPVADLPVREDVDELQVAAGRDCADLPEVAALRALLAAVQDEPMGAAAIALLE
jgi:hypothetical protein